MGLRYSAPHRICATPGADRDRCARSAKPRLVGRRSRARVPREFHLLRSNEALARHDQNGREVPKDTWAPYEQDAEGVDLGRYVPPFTKPDREAEMRHAYAVFDERYGAPKP